MKVIIAGGRDYNNYSELERYCDTILANQTDVEIVSGTAKGADSLGERYATERQLPIKRFPADWDRLEKTAGYIRNKEMAVYADAVILFWEVKQRK